MEFLSGILFDEERFNGKTLHDLAIMRAPLDL